MWRITSGSLSRSNRWSASASVKRRSTNRFVSRKICITHPLLSGGPGIALRSGHRQLDGLFQGHGVTFGPGGRERLCPEGGPNGCKIALIFGWGKEVQRRSDALPHRRGGAQEPGGAPGLVPLHGH